MIEVKNHNVGDVDFKLANVKSRKIERHQIPDEYEEAVFDADDFIIYGPASVEIVDRSGQEIKMEAIEEDLDRFMESENLISLKHDDVKVGEPVWEYDGNETGVEGDTFYLCANIGNDTEKKKQARLQALRGDLDGYSITVYSTEEGTRESDGARITNQCDIHSVTLGAGDLLMNPEAGFNVVDYKSGLKTGILKRLNPSSRDRLRETIDQKMGEWKDTIDPEDRTDDFTADGPVWRGPEGTVAPDDYEGSMEEAPGADRWTDEDGNPLTENQIRRHYNFSQPSVTEEIAGRYDDGEMNRYEARKRIKKVEDLPTRTEAAAILEGLSQKTMSATQLSETISQKLTGEGFLSRWEDQTPDPEATTINEKIEPQIREVLNNKVESGDNPVEYASQTQYFTDTSLVKFFSWIDSELGTDYSSEISHERGEFFEDMVSDRDRLKQQIEQKFSDELREKLPGASPIDSPSDYDSNVDWLEQNDDYIQGPRGNWWTRQQLQTAGVGPPEWQDDYGDDEDDGSSEDLMDRFESEFSQDDFQTANYSANEYSKGNISLDDATSQIERVYGVGSNRAQEWIEGVSQKAKSVVDLEYDVRGNEWWVTNYGQTEWRDYVKEYDEEKNAPFELLELIPQSRKRISQLEGEELRDYMENWNFSDDTTEGFLNWMGVETPSKSLEELAEQATDLSWPP